MVLKRAVTRADDIVGTRNAAAGHAPADVAERRERSRWYTTKTEPSFEDMTIKLRRVIIAARFRPRAPHQASPEETRAVLLAWAAAET